MSANRRNFLKNACVATVGASIGTSFGAQQSPVVASDVIRWDRWQDNYFFGQPISGFKYTGVAGLMQEWIDWVQIETNGRLQIRRSEPGALVKAAESFTAASRGMLDGVGVTSGFYHSGSVPEANVEVGLPMAWESNGEAYNAYYNYGLYEEMTEIYAAQNLKFFPILMHDYYNLATTFPIERPEQLQGKKIRAGGVYGDFVKMLGGSPVNIPPAEMYLALQSGVIDGVLYGMHGVFDQKLHEMLKYYVVAPIMNTIVASFLINRRRWERLPPDIQDTIERNTRYVMAGAAQNYLYQTERKLIEAEKTFGLQRVVWSVDDTNAMRRRCIDEIWPSIAKQHSGNQKLVNVVVKQQKDAGKI